MTVDAETLAANLDDPAWRLSHLYKIITKGDGDDGAGLVVDFKPNKFQRRLLRTLWHRNVILKARQLGYCLAPETRVLRADLTWAPIASLNPGDEVVAVDEFPSGGRGSARRMRTATVQAAVEVHRMAYRVTFDDGRQVVCTAQHPWLSRSQAVDGWDWRSIEPREGESPKKRLRVGYRVRSVTQPWDAPTAEDGWFGGMLDGEGSMAKPEHTPGINVSQRHGAVWDRLVAYARTRGYHACVENDGGARPSKFGRVPVPKLSFGRMDELFRLLGQTRPTRFVDRRFWEGRFLPGRRNGDGAGYATITAIEPIGMQTMIDLQTSTGTYIAEGLVSHNTTVIAILWLDTALFSKSPIRCGIIAQNREKAEEIFRDKVKFAYDHLPEALRERFPLERDSASELLFKHNGASIRVATSMRSGTLHRLHVSEFGKICAQSPDKAREIVTGSIPAVPMSGILAIESTAEGNEGAFHDIAMRALALQQEGRALTPRDYRMHFTPWYEADDYELDPDLVSLSDADRKYFDEVEALMKVTISARKRAWYVATRDSEFSGDRVMMGQEYPSTPTEAFSVSMEGCYYSEQLAAARKAGRIVKTIPVESVPVNTFWDLGRGDMTSIWFHQRVGMENRFLRYYENSGEDLSHYVQYLQGLGYVFGTHYLPHDANYKRLGESPDTNRSIKEMLEDMLPGHRFEIVPRVSALSTGIQAVRNVFASCWFDETGCRVGLGRLQNYRKKWNKATGAWSDEPLHNDNSHGSDAFRQFGQAADNGDKFTNQQTNRPSAGILFRRRNTSPMAV